MHPRLFAPITFALLAIASASLHANELVTLIEAESRDFNRASVTVVPAADASGESYVNNPTGYLPLFNGDWPAQEAAHLTVWARVRGHAIQLKSVDADKKQTEHGWSWARPAAWRWVNLGTHERAILGVGFVIIRAADGPADAGLDAVIVTNDPNFRPRETQP